MKQGRVRNVLNKIRRPYGVNNDAPAKDNAANTTSHGPKDISRIHDTSSHFAGLNEQDLERLNQAVQDYQIVHGGLLKAVLQENAPPTASGRVLGVSLYPSPFPKRLFEEACELQKLFQRLYFAVSSNVKWLETVLRDLVLSDPLTKVLWDVVCTTKIDGPRRGSPISAVISRSDYMIHADAKGKFQLKQVEFNTIACAGAAHGQRIANMHRYLYKTGEYRTSSNVSTSERQNPLCLNVPPNDNVRNICTTLETAHHAYMQLRMARYPSELLPFCILMVVQPNNYNIADERPIEYELWSRDPPVRCFRLEWGEDLLEYTNTNSSGDLHFQLPHLAERCEVSVVYYRAGFEPHEYKERLGYDARVRFETSNAVQCPNILNHLVGSKRVQQALCASGELENFIDLETANRLRSTFMQMYPLDDSQSGAQGRELAINPETAENYVLKPSRDGGGHNIYRDAIPSFLNSLPRNRWAEYILMEMINPVAGRNALASSRGVWIGDVIAEIGIWGGSVCQHTEGEVEIIANDLLGWSVRSKSPHVNEMSVVKGYGCFDSIALINEEVCEAPSSCYNSNTS